MDRKIIYPGQIPLETDLLEAQQFAFVALGEFLRAALGTDTCCSGLAVVPQVPASLVVQVKPGSIYTYQNVDNADLSTITADVAHQIIKQGVLADAVNLTLTPPTTAGEAVNYLIQAAFQETDEDPIVLPYYNSADPSIPFSGPNNSGATQYTRRRGKVVVSAKAGVSAISGTQVTPTADLGYVPLAVVTVAQGAVALTATEIAVHASSPYITKSLPEIPQWVQQGTWAFGANDTGTANAAKTVLNPVPKDAGRIHFYVKKMASANTGAMTIDFGFGAVPLLTAAGGAMPANAWPASFVAHIVYDGAAARMINAAVATAVGSLTASAGEGIDVSGGGVISLNYPGLTNKATPEANALWSYYSPDDTHHRMLTTDQLKAMILPSAAYYAPIYPHVDGAGTINILAGVGSVVVNAGSVFVYRGAMQVKTDEYNLAARTFNTAANKTYHLRWRWNGGTPLFQLLDVTNPSYNPSSLDETNVAFDSTYDDMLIAKVVTSAGNVPTVTALVNKNTMKYRTVNGGNTAPQWTNVSGRTIALTYNFARKPEVMAQFYDVQTGTSSATQSDAPDHDMGIKITSSSRYGATVDVYRDFSGSISLDVLAIAI